MSGRRRMAIIKKRLAQLEAEKAKAAEEEAKRKAEQEAKAKAEAEAPVEEQPKRQPSTVVATASREGGQTKPSQVRLTQTQVKIARQLGISPEQYANQLLKEA